MQETSVSKDMALTLADLKRGLPAALGDTPYKVSGSRVDVGDEAKGVSIHFKALPPRKFGIALLAIARGEVRLVFRGYDEAEQEAFLLRFDKAYQRGGG